MVTLATSTWAPTTASAALAISAGSVAGTAGLAQPSEAGQATSGYSDAPAAAAPPFVTRPAGRARRFAQMAAAFAPVVGIGTTLAAALYLRDWSGLGLLAMAVPVSALTLPGKGRAQPPRDPDLVFSDHDLTRPTIRDPQSVVYEMLVDLSQRDPAFAAPYMQAVVRQADRVDVARRAMDQFLQGRPSSDAAIAIRLWEGLRDQLPQSDGIEGFRGDGFGHQYPNVTPETVLLRYARRLPQPWMTWLLDGVLRAVPGNLAVANNLAHLAECFTVMTPGLEVLSHHIVTGLLDLARKTPSVAEAVLDRLHWLAQTHPNVFVKEHIPVLHEMTLSNAVYYEPPRGALGLARSTLERLKIARPDLFETLEKGKAPSQ